MDPGACNLAYTEEGVAQVPLAEDDGMVETSPPGRANQAFRMAILPWHGAAGRTIRHRQSSLD